MHRMGGQRFEEARVQGLGALAHVPCTWEKSSPAAGVGPCVVGVWPRPLELGTCLRGEALGRDGRHWGLSRPLGSELRGNRGLGPECVYVTMRQVFC